MPAACVEVPASLLLDPELTASAKVLWMLARADDSAGPSLRVRAGLNRETVRNGLANLAAEGWYSSGAILREPAEGMAVMPVGLVGLPDLGSSAKVLYGALQLTPGYGDQAGQFTYACLSKRTRTSRNTVKRAVKELVRAGWLRLKQAHQLAPIEFTLGTAETDRSMAEAVRSQQRIRRRKEHRGEAIMKEYLSLLIDSDQFGDNARHGFLVNPLTHERLEFDRFYPPAVAFEFNGPQHHRPTDFATQEDVDRQRTRDLVKLGLCVEQGIHLVVVQEEDLTLETMQQKVGHLLPRRDLRGLEPQIAVLESESRRYRAEAKDWGGSSWRARGAGAGQMRSV